MGAALAHRLIDCGEQIYIWNRDSKRPAVQKLIDRGATFEFNISQVVIPCPVVIVCVLDYASLDPVLQGVGPRALVDKAVVNFTNGTPSEAIEMSEKLKHGAWSGCLLCKSRAHERCNAAF